MPSAILTFIFRIPFTFMILTLLATRKEDPCFYCYNGCGVWRQVRMAAQCLLFDIYKKSIKFFNIVGYAWFRIIRSLTNKTYDTCLHIKCIFEKTNSQNFALKE